MTHSNAMSAIRGLKCAQF